MGKQVLIVDSDDRQIQRITGVLKEMAVQSGSRMEIYAANTLEEAGVIIEETDVDVLILDSVYKGMALEEYPGIMWAQRIRECEKYISLPIVFISSVSKPKMYAYQEINCMGFLPRQFNGEELQRILEKAMHHNTLREGDKSICVRAQGILYPFQIKDILYVEVLNRILYIYRTNGEVLEMHHKPLRDFQAEVNSKCLIQCNKSMLINTRYVAEVNEKKGYVTLSRADVQLLVGKKYIDEVRAAMQRRRPKYILK